MEAHQSLLIMSLTGTLTMMQKNLIGMMISLELSKGSGIESLSNCIGILSCLSFVIQW